MTDARHESVIDDPRQLRQSNFPVLWPMQLRWLDVDRYGHVNNAVNYELMDTAINSWLAEQVGKDVRVLSAFGVVVETGCRFFREMQANDKPILGIRLEGTGTSSVRYEVGFFIDDDEPVAIAKFVHVYVDPETRRPSRIPDEVSQALQLIQP